MFVKPNEGREIRDPFKRTLLPNEGAEVPDNDPFWKRRVRDKDVVVINKKADVKQKGDNK